MDICYWASVSYIGRSAFSITFLTISHGYSLSRLTPNDRPNNRVEPRPSNPSPKLFFKKLRERQNAPSTTAMRSLQKDGFSKRKKDHDAAKYRFLRLARRVARTPLGFSLGPTTAPLTIRDSPDLEEIPLYFFTFGCRSEVSHGFAFFQSFKRVPRSLYIGLNIE